MSFANFQTIELRASDPTGVDVSSGQDAAVTLPDLTDSMWVHIQKTAEANGDNLLTARLQCQNPDTSAWFDIPYQLSIFTSGLTQAVDGAVQTNVSNLVETNTTSAWNIAAYYKLIPYKVIRVAWISSGTADSHTFSVYALVKQVN